MKDQNKLIDRLLDLGLARRSEAEPETGLENRILARLQQQSMSPRLWKGSRQFGLSLAAAGALAVCAAIFFFYPAHNHQPAAPNFKSAGALQKSDTLTHSEQSAATQAAIASGRRVAEAVPRHKKRFSTGALEARRAEAAPRQSVFPSPAPLTEQEKILISLVKHNDRKALDALAETLPPPGPPAPLVIKPIVIKPLGPPAPLASP